MIDFSKDWRSFYPNIKTDFEQQVFNFIEEWFSPSSTVKIKTSGSTGKPKVIEIEKNKMLASAQRTCNFLRLKEGNSALLCLPIDYISGKMMIIRSIYAQLRLYLVSPSSQPLERLSQEIDFCALTPLQAQNSLNKISYIQKMIIGGAEVNKTLEQKLISPHRIVFETYGMSETLSHIALRKISPTTQQYFRVLNGVSVSLDERQRLVIDAPHIANEKITTNDIVDIKNEKEFRFLGRLDFVINSGGIKIYPEFLEKNIKQLLDREVIFLSKPDEKLGQKLILAIEGKQEKSVLEKINLYKFENKAHRPKKIYFIKNFPRNETGKILRKELQNLLQIHFEPVSTQIL